MNTKTFMIIMALSLNSLFAMQGGNVLQEDAVAGEEPDVLLDDLEKEAQKIILDIKILNEQIKLEELKETASCLKGKIEQLKKERSEL